MPFWKKNGTPTKSRKSIPLTAVRERLYTVLFKKLRLGQVNDGKAVVYELVLQQTKLLMTVSCWLLHMKKVVGPIFQ